jgi:cell wall-associated NlpC family hydrolase
MPTRADILRYARSLIGTPFHHQGRLPKVGLDCVGLLAAVYDLIGANYDDYTNYSPSPDGRTFEAEFDKALDRIKPEEVGVGDVLTFWWRTRGKMQHCAILTDVGMIHTWATVHKVVEHHFDERWKTRIMGCYRFKGVDPTPYTKPIPIVVDPMAVEVIKRMTRVSCCGE